MKQFADKFLSYNENRESNFELLRIVAMFLIVLHHFCYHGVISHYAGLTDTLALKINNFILLLFSSGGKMGVDIFLILSGYFLINKSFKLNNFLEIFLTTLFYSLLFLFGAFVIGSHHVSGEILNKSIFIIGGNAYWFITAYLVIYLFINYINKLLKILTLKEYITMLLIGFIIWCLIPTYSKAYYAFSVFGWFLFLYASGAFIRRYNINLKIKHCIIIIAVCLILSSFVFLHVLSKPVINLWSGYMEMNNLYQFLTAVSLFFIAKNIKIENKFINWMSGSVLAVYLIHDNMILRPFLWQKTINANLTVFSGLFILKSLFISAGIFLICVLINSLLRVIYVPLTEKIIYLINLGLQNLIKYNKK